MEHPLEQRIDAFRKRVRRLLFVHAVCWIAATLAGAIVLFGLVDFFLRFQDRGIRLICWLLVLGVLGWGIFRFWLVGLGTRLSNVELARCLERRFPHLGDRLASAVEFLGQSEDDPTAGSPALRRTVIAEATAECEPLDFRDAIRAVPVARAAGVTSGIFLVVGILVVLAPLNSGIAIARLFKPFGNDQWPQTYRLSLLTEDVTKVARGGVFEVEVVDAGGLKPPSNARIHYRFVNDDGTTTDQTELMRFVDGSIASRRADGTSDPRREAGVMVARREKVSRDFSFRIEGGDDRSMAWTAVEVAEPPSFQAMEIELTPPKYTGWPRETAENSVRAIVGSRLKISAKATKPLRSADVCFEGGRRVSCRLSGEKNRQVGVEFEIERSGAYWFRLTDSEGLVAGHSHRGEIRAVADVEPSIAIEEPGGNVFVTPQAVVPLRVLAKDDLAVHRVDLKFLRVAPSKEEVSSEQSLFAGPDRVAPGPSGFSTEGVRIVVPYRWDLSNLELKPGSQITYFIQAADYRPNTAQSDSRRLMVITPEELTERIAARQTTILARLADVLETEQQSRRQVGELEIRATEARLDHFDVDHLRGAELNQREVARMLTSRSEGVPVEILGLLADLANNKVDSPDIDRRMRGLLDQIDRLDREHLPVLGRELTTAVKAAQADLPPGPVKKRPDEEAHPARPDRKARGDPTIARSLEVAGAHQDRVIEVLEQMLDELGRWDRYRRFHSKINHLLRDQEELARGTGELGGRTLGKDPGNLPSQEAADLKILARRQLDLGRELGKILQGMDQAVSPLRKSDPLFAETIADALYRARELATMGKMQAAGAQLRQNRIGHVLREQKAIAADLREILNILANRREHELVRLVKQLRQAEQELAELVERQEGLRKKIEEAEALSDDEQRRGELERLSKEQERLRDPTERIARRLERLMAEAAGNTARRAGEKMRQASRAAKEGEGKGAAKQAHQAKRDLQQAREQVGQERRQAEAELAIEQLARLEETLQAMRKQQEKVSRETGRFDQIKRDQGELSRSQNASLHGLARDQALLESETSGLVKKLRGAAVFHLALGRAAEQMSRAAALLDRRQTGVPTQEAQQNALARLDQLLEALKPAKPQPPDENPEGSSGGAGDQGNAQSPPGSGLQTLAELKLLKLLQEEVNLRTAQLREELGPHEKLPESARRQFEQLGREQGHLADLLLSLIAPEKDPEDVPDSLPGTELDDERSLLPPIEEN